MGDKAESELSGDEEPRNVNEDDRAWFDFFKGGRRISFSKASEGFFENRRLLVPATESS